MANGARARNRPPTDASVGELVGQRSAQTSLLAHQEAIREEIEDTRQELGDPIEGLAEKTDLRAQDLVAPPCVYWG